jgi:cobalt-precorrin 5A hydrolase / precorrin-3B C17-methyltransferase
VNAGLPKGAVVVALTQVGADLARRIARLLPGAEVHGLSTRVDNADVPFAKTAMHLRQLFRDGRPIVGVIAAGALVRILAPVLTDKHDDPPVLSVAEDGSAVVPLLGAHHGANRLAVRIAKSLRGFAAVTNASDIRFGGSFDDPGPGWVVRGDPKAAMATALANYRPGPDARMPEIMNLTPMPGRFGVITVLTDDAIADQPGVAVLHPKTLAVGLGCERGADPSELMELACAVIKDSGYALDSVACIATIDLKEDEPAMRFVAESLGVPLRLFTAEALERETPRVKNPSAVVFKEVGTHSVAEAAALAAAGEQSRLEIPKRKSPRCTAALAKSYAHDLLDPERIGRAPGLLWIVGIGPGRGEWRTPEATTAIATATDLVGYSLYLDLLGELAVDKSRHDYALGEETERVKHALTLAAEGKTVALISSGDAGIYAMAALAYELIDAAPPWQRLDVRVAPGISALQAAAARLGAPLGHDFCAVSLSDLLTPWDAIEKRLSAAAQGDFVTVLYNPASNKRRAPFESALKIFRATRPGDTPVGLARNLGRPDEQVRIVPLRTLDIGMVDMLTTVVIGSSTSREIPSSGGRRMYTPRGYAAKATKAPAAKRPTSRSAKAKPRKTKKTSKT